MVNLYGLPIPYGTKHNSVHGPSRVTQQSVIRLIPIWARSFAQVSDLLEYPYLFNSDTTNLGVENPELES